MNSVLDNITKIKVEREDEMILNQLKNLIISGELKPGDRLPPERQLAEKFNVGRGYVRLAIQKLEFFGIVKTLPNSGTLISELGITILKNYLGNILSFENPDEQALMETRKIIEIETVRLAAIRRDTESLKRLREAYDMHAQQIINRKDGLEEDILFHSRLADCAKNRVLHSLIMVISQDIVNQSRSIDGCADDRKFKAAEEHKEILIAIEKNDPDAASSAMSIHLDNTKFSSNK